jgi:hypothetical protein
LLLQAAPAVYASSSSKQQLASNSMASAEEI